MLVKDPRLRPSISSVIKRFEHVYALLVVTGQPRFDVESNKPFMTETTLLEYLHQSINMLDLGHENKQNNGILEENHLQNNFGNYEAILSINQDIYY